MDLLPEFCIDPIAVRKSFEYRKTFRAQLQVPEIVVLKRCQVRRNLIKPVNAYMFHSAPAFVAVATVGLCPTKLHAVLQSSCRKMFVI